MGDIEDILILLVVPQNSLYGITRFYFGSASSVLYCLSPLKTCEFISHAFSMTSECSPNNWYILPGKTIEESNVKDQLAVTELNKKLEQDSEDYKVGMAVWLTSELDLSEGELRTVSLTLSSWFRIIRW